MQSEDESQLPSDESVGCEIPEGVQFDEKIPGGMQFEDESQLPSHKTYTPDCAILNVYRRADRLRCHVDDAEEEKTAPLISIGLGQPAIFLLGGSSSHQTPLPILLRSGDVLVLSGVARQSYHGLASLLLFNAAKNLRCSRQRRRIREKCDALSRELELHQTAVASRLARVVNNPKDTSSGADWIDHLWFAEQIRSETTGRTSPSNAARGRTVERVAAVVKFLRETRINLSLRQRSS